MSVYLWIALGVVVVALLTLGGLAFDLYGHVRRLTTAAALARRDLVPKARRLEPLLSVQLARPRLTGNPQQSNGARQPKHSVESKSRHLEERT